jgi:outer membrane protein assembly factor BamB
MSRLFALFAVALVAAPFAAAPKPPVAKQTTWPMFGGTPARNMVNHTDRGIPRRFHPADDCLWKADLGSRSYGGPVVSGGLVFVGTNNERPRKGRDQAFNPAEQIFEPIDRGILMCFDQRNGEFLWQAVFDKLDGGQVSDWPREGICCTPTVEGKRIYFVSNRCTVVCADVSGFADGNQGITTEKYHDPSDCDTIWEYDMRRELNVFPHNMSQSYPLIVGDRVFVCTSNGVDESHLKLPCPEAPSFIALDKHTGKLIWKDNSPGKDILHGQWASPAYAAEPVPQVIFPGGDGWLRAFDPPTGRLLWKFDCNPKGAVYQLGGAGNRSDFIASPVIDKGRLFIGVGQDPEHTDGIGKFWCIDLKKAVEGGRTRADRDVSPDILLRLEKQAGGNRKAVTEPNPASAKVWMYGGEDRRPFSVRDFHYGRTMSTACVVDDILYIGELTGYVHCIDALTGKHYWEYDTKSAIWTSCYYVDGKVLIANDNGDLYVFRHDPKPETIEDQDPNAPNQKAARAFRLLKRKEVEQKYLLSKIEFPTSIRTTPCVAGGVLYVATEDSLYAIGKK